MKAEIGIIGGSGLYSMPGFEAAEEVVIKTPFGDPSDNYVLGTLAGKTSPSSRATGAAIASRPRS
jgi:5'-methylthioadenosine phosphorylase